ncbi:2-succinyl-5-enolpyruvyl-6-hydroxy-3-cyclohexene-1-carboxylic-acid synthase [Dongshaea marina]|uniref:2-succinyl-5-enolpyruvyl-6-hydroxy-3- cyclohexene-1-carboxylic-acid synthase n=1 Tax=Dongshaea marina TaxID=2047966 RepID=UPI000D3EA5ED|nr:2-succinyl-5-enolpyruvyl-6-hydroxy-3-cyclohexene-1-carboxylic-acid synthase [Dongshaea marina]
MIHKTFANLNHLWASALLEELYRWGVRDLCIAPGSRSAPLVMAAAAHQGFITHTHFDERGLGFLGLGIAKGTERPVVIITTSGSAVANLYPAVVEARQCAIPLIILSADRPPELIDCGANQAIPQPGIFANYPVTSINLPAPSSRIPLSFLLTSIDDALSSLISGPAGPVHINCMYPEPLYPAEQPLNANPLLEPLSRWLESETPYTRYHQAEIQVQTHQQWSQLRSDPGLLIAGQIDSPRQAKQLQEWARELGWPLLCDLQSQLAWEEGTLNSFDLNWQSPELQEQLSRAQVVIQFGARLLSKNLARWLTQRSWQHYWLIDPQQQRLDPDHLLSERFCSPVAQWLEAHPTESGNRAPSDLSSVELGLARLCREYFSRREFGELSAVWELSALLQGQLFIGNSMPVRLLDNLPLGGDGPARLMTNRGASGIDGLIATASGFARTSSQPTTVLIGDLSLLHDLNSLALTAESQAPLVIILINNGGGSIFRMLPVPNENRMRERFFELKHQLNARGAAQMFGLDYHQPDNLDDFSQTYQQALKTRGASLIELQIETAGCDELKALRQWINDAASR